MRTVAVAMLLSLVVLGCTSTTKKTSNAVAAVVSATDSRLFSPESVNVPLGRTVRWTDTGQLAHTVTFDNGPTFSQPLSPASTVTRTFTTAGTYAYHCNIHGPSMHGQLVVG